MQCWCRCRCRCRYRSQSEPKPVRIYGPLPTSTSGQGCLCLARLESARLGSFCDRLIQQLALFAQRRDVAERRNLLLLFTLSALMLISEPPPQSLLQPRPRLRRRWKRRDHVDHTRSSIRMPWRMCGEGKREGEWRRESRREGQSKSKFGFSSKSESGRPLLLWPQSIRHWVLGLINYR